MQDRYAGDLGDFLKLGLLRWLVAPSHDAPSMPLGVVWFLAPEESHNADGKHVAYLDPASRAGGELRPLDADLYDRLAAMVVSGSRSVASLEAAGVLPAGSRTFADRLDLQDLPPSARAARTDRRRRWLDDALAATADSWLVFFDPDNGVRRSDHRTKPYQSKAEKHTYLSELVPFVQRGQSVVVYHHADRSASVPVQAERRLADLHHELGVDPLAAIRASRGSTRLFLIVPAPEHRERLGRRIDQLSDSSWSAELMVYRA